MPKLPNTLVVLPYDPNWPIEFERIRDYLLEQIGDLILEIKHIGSTSVPGLWAKPIIDIVAVMDSYDAFPAIVARLEAIGYHHNGDQGIKDREVFKRLIPDDFMDYHFYVCPKDSEESRRHNKFRNALLANKEIANEYGKLKIRLIEEVNGDRVLYTDSKTEFILGVMRDTENPEILLSGERINIRRACINDAKFMNGVETAPDNSPWVGNWPLGYRIAKFGDDDVLQTIIELKDGTPIGMIIFRDMLKKDEQVELKRIALSSDFKAKGYGKEALYLAQRLAFEIFGTQKLYLGTKAANLRAQGIYKATGFTPEEPDPCTRFHIMKEQYFKHR